MKKILIIGSVFLVLSSCATRKDILYLQDSENYNNTSISYLVSKIQPNDILKINVGALVNETAIPYNNTAAVGGGQSVELMKLEGYLVSENNTINFPILGFISTLDKTTSELESYLIEELKNGGHLSEPKVNVRLLNAKVTILGEVNNPGVYNFTEQNITLLQAIGYAGDLTINGKRDDIKLIRESNGNRTITHINITSAEFFNSEFNIIKPNDTIIVDPNGPKVKSAGYVGNIATFLSVISILFTTVVLITR